MECTTGSVLEPRPVEHDAGVIDGVGDPLSVVVLEDGTTHLFGSIGELPLSGFEGFDLAADRLAVGFVDEVGAVGATAVLVLRSEFSEHPRATRAVDALVVAGEEGDVEEPGVAVVVGEGDPLVEVRRHLSHGPDGTRTPGDTVPGMAGEFDEIRGRLETIAEDLADLAIQRLRESIDAGGRELPVDEKRITRARRAVEKAIHLLQEPDEGY